PTPFPYTTLFRSAHEQRRHDGKKHGGAQRVQILLLLVAQAGSIPAIFAYMMGRTCSRFNARHIMSKPETEGQNAPDPLQRKVLSPAAQRALAEAEARRAEYLRREAALPKELGGRGGKEPIRYGDWEVKGMTSDF